MLRPFTRYDEPEHVISVPGSATSNGLGREVSTALVHCRPGIIGTSMSRGSQYMFIITKSSLRESKRPGLTVVPTWAPKNGCRPPLQKSFD